MTFARLPLRGWLCIASLATIGHEPHRRAIVKAVGSLGYVVQIGGAWGRVRVTATGDDGETFVVGGDDLYAAACELAEQAGIELEG